MLVSGGTCARTFSEGVLFPVPRAAFGYSKYLVSAISSGRLFVFFFFNHESLLQLVLIVVCLFAPAGYSDACSL